MNIKDYSINAGNLDIKVSMGNEEVERLNNFYEHLFQNEGMNTFREGSNQVIALYGLDSEKSIVRILNAGTITVDDYMKLCGLIITRQIKN